MVSEGELKIASIRNKEFPKIGKAKFMLEMEIAKAAYKKAEELQVEPRILIDEITMSIVAEIIIDTHRTLNATALQWARMRK